jgi:hypothetical protein
MVVFYNNLDDIGTILEECDSLDAAAKAIDRLSLEYPNDSIHRGGVLEIESCRR